MRLPPLFRDLPNDAVRRVIDLFNQPQLIQSVQEAAQKVGATTEWGTNQLQDSMRQAKRWIDTVSEHWRAEVSRSTIPVINATGEVFASRWSSPPMSIAAATAYSGVTSGYVDQTQLRLELQRELCRISGAEAALVLHNVSSAMTMLAVYGQRHGGWIMPRSAALRLPDGGDVAAIFEQFNAFRQIGAINGCSSDDVVASLSDKMAAGLFSVSPDPVPVQEPTVSLFSKLAGEHKTKFAELRFDATLCDLKSIVAGTVTLAERLSAGGNLIIAPGNTFLGGPVSAIVLGDADLIKSLETIAQSFGLFPDSVTSAMLLASLPQNENLDAWKASPLGMILSTTLENQMQRAKRLSLQIAASPLIESAELEQIVLPLGPSPFTQMTLSTVAIHLKPAKSLQDLKQRLQSAPRPVQARVVGEQLQLIMRTIDPADDRHLVSAFGMDDSQSNDL